MNRAKGRGKNTNETDDISDEPEKNQAHKERLEATREKWRLNPSFY
jgi:hypothetical protein